MKIGQIRSELDRNWDWKGKMAEFRQRPNNWASPIKKEWDRQVWNGLEFGNLLPTNPPPPPCGPPPTFPFSSSRRLFLFGRVPSIGIGRHRKWHWIGPTGFRISAGFLHIWLPATTTATTIATTIAILASISGKRAIGFHTDSSHWTAPRFHR